jgi:branched-chain amino acid transport system ATP-binding protein
MNGEILRIENLSKSFGGVTAVRDCTFSVTQGTVLGLIGPNGAGKSTVVDLVSGFGRPDAGRITFAGTQITGKRPDIIARLGLIRTFQTPREWRQLTVLQNVLVARCGYSREALWHTIVRGRRIRRDELAERAKVMEILDRYQLADLRDIKAGDLSGGQKRLLEFARVAAADPTLVILDEPMGGVNPVLGTRIGEAIRHFADEGHTVIVVEHNLPFIQRISDEVVVMDTGEVIAQGSFDSLRDNPRVVDAYLGMDQSHE